MFFLPLGLNLNVFVPADTATDAKLPVIVVRFPCDSNYSDC